MRRVALALGFLALAASLAHAHDFLLWPEMAGSGAVDVRLLVHDGEAIGDERAFRQDRVARVLHASSTGLRNLAGRDGARPFLHVGGLAPGGHWLGVDRRPVEIELAADRFDAYLAHEGLEAIRAERRRRGESAQPGRERYTRFLKAFVQLGDRRDGAGCRALGQAFEIVPLVDPATLRSGHPLPVELRLDGRPLPRHPLGALRAGDEPSEDRFQTDDAGRVAIPLQADGRLALLSVYMRRCQGCEGVEWESRWTAMTVDVAPSGPPPSPCAER